MKVLELLLVLSAIALLGYGSYDQITKRDKHIAYLQEQLEISKQQTQLYTDRWVEAYSAHQDCINFVTGGE
ncbi:MAG: hypothetical protein KKD44_29195 [Proteobacteria bacterium]|nr:hypothetical protein [Pseudomonadota bacterium]